MGFMPGLQRTDFVFILKNDKAKKSGKICAAEIPARSLLRQNVISV